jgi:NitT/TauT family transport system substrate-binding protein
MSRTFKFITVFVLFTMFVVACATGTPAVRDEAQGGGTAEATGEGTAEATGEAHGEATAAPEAESTEPAEATVAPDSAPEVTPDATESVGIIPVRYAIGNTAGEGAAQAASNPVTLFLGYIPNVQFAPIYVALEKGYFAEQGIDLTIEHSFDETDGLTRIGTNRLQFGMISGEQVLLARSQGAPVVYVFRWYQRFPVGVVVPADSGITEPQQLAGKVVGIPGLYGASYFGLQALLAASDMSESDLGELKPIGFDTAPVMCGGQVEASVVYIANEPLQIAAQCFDVDVISIADYANIVSNGLVTNETTIAENPELVRGMAIALAQGLADTIANPEEAYELSLAQVEGLAPDDEVQYQVLLNSVELWKAEQLGYSDPESWQLTLDTLIGMSDAGLIDAPDLGSVVLEEAFTNEFLPETPSSAALGKG